MGDDSPLIGVLALQGGFAAHTRMLRRLGPTPPSVREVRTRADLEGIEGLVIPGGESTTMTLGIEREGLREPLRELIAGGPSPHGRGASAAGDGAGSGHRDGAGGVPVLGSCAGLIMLDREHLGVMDMRAERNAFGRQIKSFEADVVLRGISDPPARPLHGVFIRAPWIVEHGPGVEILGEVDGHAVAARQGDILAVAFHSELTTDDRLHRLLLDAVERRRTHAPAGDGSPPARGNAHGR
jgi:5'-phosphate synthase pdxT subunit